MSSKAIDLLGRTFGSRKVISRADNDKTGRARWEVVCGCGKVDVVPATNLVRGVSDRCQMCRFGLSSNYWMARVTVDSSGCWLWNGALKADGYARSSFYGVILYVHRAYYEHFVGPVPEGLQLDHLCRVRHCVNPAHLEPVTCQENVRRGHADYYEKRSVSDPAPADAPLCKRGHPLGGYNLYIQPSTGIESCKQCRAIDAARYRARKKAAAL